MSITDELRKVAAKTECANGRCEKLYRGDLDHIADRIDEEHESACAEAYGNGVQSVALPDMTNYIELPKDADGVTIHLGDMLEIEHGHGVLDSGEVTDIHLQVGKCAVSIGFGDEEGVTAYPEDYRHVQPVEDVLREFTDEVWNRCCEGATASDSGIDELVAEYAAKLRLAGENA